MTDYGLVSIITPAYNSSQFIAATIESILAQTYKNWELLITDDCSTDNTCQIVLKYADNDERIKLFRLESNSGAGVARNLGIEKARGRYIAFCDSDDRWYPDKLAKQLSFMTTTDCALSYTSYTTCNESGQNVGIVICRNRETLFSMKCDDGIGCLTAVYDTSKVGKVMLPKIRRRQDWGLWLKILSQCKFAYGITEPLAIYRLRTDSLSSRKFKLIKYNLAVYREVLGWSYIKSLLFFFFIFLPSYTMKKIRQHCLNRRGK